VGFFLLLVLDLAPRMDLYAAGILTVIALAICLYQVGMRRGVDTATVMPPPIRQKQTSLEAQVSDAAHDRKSRSLGLRSETGDCRPTQAVGTAIVRYVSAESGTGTAATTFRNNNAGKQDGVSVGSDSRRNLKAPQKRVPQGLQKVDLLAKQSSEDQAQAGEMTAQVKDLTQALHESRHPR